MGKVLGSISAQAPNLLHALQMPQELLKTLLEKLRGDTIWAECASYPSLHFAVHEDEDLAPGTLLKIPQVHILRYGTLWYFGCINMVTIPSISWQMKIKPES